MTSDFRAFAICPKTHLAAGTAISAAHIQAQASKLGGFKTPFVYACFGDVTLTGVHTPTNGITVGAGTDTIPGAVLKQGCIMPIAKGTPIDLGGSANPAMILWFAT